VAFFNPFRAAYLENPYPVLAKLRRDEPVHWSAELNAWVLTRYEDCLAVLQDDDRFSSDPARAGGAFGEEVRAKRAAAPLSSATIMGNSDPPMHTQLRAIVNRGFVPRVIEAMRPRIEAAVDQLLDEIDPGQPFDAVSKLAEPLAVSAVLEHLGIPRERFGDFRQWSLALMRARAEGPSAPGVIEVALNAREEMLGMLAECAEAGAGSGSVLDVLIEACDGEAISPDEMVMMLIHLSLAGNGPTAMALGNAVATLAEYPEAQEQLRQAPDEIPAAIDELLRFDSSTHFVVRFALQDTRVGPRTVKAGQQIHVMVGAANRDPARFAEPDRLELGRADNRHLSFGFGIHYCLGAPLARIELATAVRKLLERMPQFERVDGEHAPSYQLRGYQRLIVRPRA
jgi:cytochrome P450